MKTWLLGSLSLISSMLVASACVLVEDFQGYGPRGDVEPCDQLLCPNTSSSNSSSSSGVGGMGGTGSSTGSSSGAGGGVLTCGKIPCNGSPCMPEVLVADSQLGLAAVDPAGLFIRTNTPTHIIRIAKPNCSIPPFDQLIEASFPDQGFVTDGQYVAWLSLDYSKPCLAPSITFCDVANCQPQQIPLPPSWEGSTFVRLALGPDYLYFTLRDGFVGRVAKGSTQTEFIWNDPGFNAGPSKRGNLLYPAVLDTKLVVVRQYIETAGAGACMGSFDANTGTIWISDTAPGTTPQPIAQSLSFPSGVAISQNYVYFHDYDTSFALKRVLKSGGNVESLAPNLKILPTYSTQSIFVNKGWVYFRIRLSNDQEGIARLPAETPLFSIDAAEIVLESPRFRSFQVDDAALYWDECVDPPNCTSFRIMARVMAP